MNNYKCISSFLSTKSKRYSYGATIGETEYNGLADREQRNFRKIESYSSTRHMEDDSPTDYSAGFMATDSSDNSFSAPDSGSSDDNSSDSNSSDSSFSGYDGGDSGGGGASGDY